MTLAFCLLLAAATQEGRTYDDFLRATAALAAKDLALGRYLWIDELPADQRDAAYRRLAAGEILTTSRSTPFGVDSGDLHHVAAAALVPRSNYDRAALLVRSYERYGEWFSPAIQKVVPGDDAPLDRPIALRMTLSWAGFQASYQMDGKARFIKLDPRHGQLALRSVKAQEIPETGRGVVLRFDAVWTLAEKDNQLFAQLEIRSLSRPGPFGLGWFAHAVIEAAERDLAKSLLEGLRKAAAVP